MARLISRNMSATDSPLLEVDSCLLLALTLVSTASLCVCVGQKRHRSPQLSGETEPGLFPLIWENRMD